MAHVFYDVTNCYFEIDFPKAEEDIRQRGVSKEYRLDPMVGFGLLMDANGLPVGMSVFPGNILRTGTDFNWADGFMAMDIGWMPADFSRLRRVFNRR